MNTTGGIISKDNKEDMGNKVLRRKCKRRGKRKVYKKLSLREIEDRRCTEEGTETCFVKAGNEGDVHMKGKIETAKRLLSQYKDKLVESENYGDGVWFEYPLTDINLLSSDYQKRKLKYLLSLYQKIVISQTEGFDFSEGSVIKNLHNIFNANLKSKVRGKKCIKSLEIKKIVDIAVVVGGSVVHVVEIVSKNKLTKIQREGLESMSESNGFVFQEIQC